MYMKEVIAIYERIQQEYKRLEQKSIEIQKELEKLLEGKLVLCSNGKNAVSWFKSDGHDKEYIKKKDIALAEKLAYKKYLMLQLEEVKHEQKAINFYLRHHQKGIPKSIQLISESSEYQQLVSSYFTLIRSGTKYLDKHAL